MGCSMVQGFGSGGDFTLSGSSREGEFALQPPPHVSSVLVVRLADEGLEAVLFPLHDASQVQQKRHQRHEGRIAVHQNTGADVDEAVARGTRIPAVLEWPLPDRCRGSSECDGCLLCDCIVQIAPPNEKKRRRPHWQSTSESGR